MGNVPHKILKHQLLAEKTPGTEDITTTAWSGDRGLTLIEMGPFGVIGAITPCTNPSETILCNSIGMIAGGNTVVFNPHPAAIKTSNFAVSLVNEASVEAGGPENIAVSLVKPTLDSSNIMMKHKDIPLIAATGGPGVVTAVLSSGKDVYKRQFQYRALLESVGGCGLKEGREFRMPFLKLFPAVFQLHHFYRIHCSAHFISPVIKFPL